MGQWARGATFRASFRGVGSIGDGVRAVRPGGRDTLQRHLHACRQVLATRSCAVQPPRPLGAKGPGLAGCPPADSGSARFRRAHPALFTATGYGIHPYPISLPPTEADAASPDTVEFSQIPQLTSLLDR